MAVGGGTGAVVKAIVGNAFVTVIKAVAWLVSGSGAMAAETIHSMVDTLNQCLLLVGSKRAQKAATERYPYGFGMEANFYAVLAAVGILVFGGGLSIQHAIHGLQHPEMPEQIGMVLGILAIATAVEAWVLYSVIKGMAATRGSTAWGEHLGAQPPGAIAVLVEDAVAVLGCLVAAAAIGLCVATNNGIWDALAQLTIGIMLMLVGLFLLWRNRGALIGQQISDKRLKALRILLEDLDGIDRVTDLKTRQLTATTFKIKAELVFSGGWLAGRLMEEWTPIIRDAVDEAAVKEAIGRFSDQLMLEQALHVDWLEKEIAARFPGAVHIDLEPHLRDT